MKYSHHYLIGLFGIISGFNLMITSGALNFWLIKSGANLSEISFSSLISLPYALNFLWISYFDYFSISYLDKIFGKNLSWICSLQILSAMIIFILSNLNPKVNINIFFFTAIILSIVLATHDSLIGVLRSKIIKPDQHGEVAGSYILGYRVGMTISSFGAILISQYFSWNLIYKFFAIILIGLSYLCYHLQKKIILQTQKNNAEKNNDLTKNTLTSIFNNTNIGQILIILLFLCLYRLPDNYINIVINFFLVTYNYNEYEIAIYGKLLGIVTAILGGFTASHLMKKMSIVKGLIIFGMIHAFAHILFILQILNQKSIFLISTLVICESFTGGMAMASYIALITRLCYNKFQSAQYALYNSMMGVSRSILPIISGNIINSYGWSNFFIAMSILALLSLTLVTKIIIPDHDK